MNKSFEFSAQTTVWNNNDGTPRLDKNGNPSLVLQPISGEAPYERIINGSIAVKLGIYPNKRYDISGNIVYSKEYNNWAFQVTGVIELTKCDWAETVKKGFVITPSVAEPMPIKGTDGKPVTKTVKDGKVTEIVVTNKALIDATMAIFNA